MATGTIITGATTAGTVITGITVTGATTAIGEVI